MSKSVVTATTAARAKSLTRAKAHKGEQNHKTTEAVVPEHSNDDAQALAVHDVKSDNTLAGDFSFSGVMGEAAASAAMMETTGASFGGMSSFAQDSGSEGSGGMFGGDSTPLIIGGVVLVGAGIAIAASGGDDDKTSTPTPTPTPNAAPVATAATAAGNEDSKITGKITATDSNNDTLTWAVKGTAPAGFTIGTDGSYTLDASNAAYQSLAAGAKSTVTANVTVSDGKGGTADSTVTFTVTGVNDAPTFDATTTKAFSVASGASSKFTISATDVDAGDKLTATLSKGPANGTIDLATNTYTAKAGFTGTDTFTVKVADTAGASVEQVVTVTITAPPSQNATISAAGTTDATTGNNTYTITAGAYTHTITGFAAGDKIVSPAGNPGTIENSSFTDGQATIQYANAGVVTQIVLTGLTAAQDQALLGTSDLNTIFGAGTFA